MPLEFGDDAADVCREVGDALEVGHHLEGARYLAQSPRHGLLPEQDAQAQAFDGTLGGGVVGLRRIDAPPLLETARARRLVRFLVQFFHMRAHRLDLRVQVGELALVFDSRHQPNLPVK